MTMTKPRTKHDRLPNVSERSTVRHRVSGVSLRSLRVDILSGPDAKRSFVTETHAITIGTAPGNHVVLSDDTVSRYHLELERTSSGILATDHGSTNGTFTGVTMLHKATIRPGTILALGKTTLKVDDGEAFTVELYEDDRLGKLRGRAPEMRRLMASIERAAQSDASALILGETGTGKELIARALHESSPRRDRPFEIVDCGAQLPALIASELFGHEKGAFTGADQQHVGAFERADGGTLFLDEIGELPLSLQPMLLGALERKKFKRVGGSKPISVDVRFVCATHRDLREEVNAGTFRQDLYYRVAVILLRVPALRERRQDIPLLVEHFLREAGYDGAVEDLISEVSMEALKSHHWPGNVRELRNFAEAVLAMGEAPQLATTSQPNKGGDLFESFEERPYADAKAELLEAFEARYLKKLLERAQGNVSEASRLAKINRGHLNTLLKKHGLIGRPIS
jgi:DNA-binding NtrC family response regulator